MKWGIKNETIINLFLAIITLLLSACAYIAELPDAPPNTETKEAEGFTSRPTSNISTQPTESNTETIAVATEETPEKGINQVTEPTPKITEIAAETTAAIEVKTEDPTMATETVVGVSASDLEPAKPEEPITIKATAADSVEIANRIVAYINEYRGEEGNCNATKLPGLTKYAEYRSRQLVTNFAHDTIDERAAATALHYGQYIDPELYGMIGEPYYTANAREAIAKTNFGGTVDAVAMHIARMARNSTDHWSYVGDSEYSFIAVGVTYESGTWYCCIAVSKFNTDNNWILF